MKTTLLLSLALLASFPHMVSAQGLIGAPDESQRPLVKRLELERAKLFHQGLKTANSRSLYGSIVWQLADKYESLNQWQDALAAQNTLKDLKLPPNALADCADCLMRASDDVLAIDQKRLASKVSSVETFDNIRFDHSKRLKAPNWGAKEQHDYEIAAKQTKLPTGAAMSLNQLLNRK